MSLGLKGLLPLVYMYQTSEYPAPKKVILSVKTRLERLLLAHASILFCKPLNS